MFCSDSNTKYTFSFQAKNWQSCTTHLHVKLANLNGLLLLLKWINDETFEPLTLELHPIFWEMLNICYVIDGCCLHFNIWCPRIFSIQWANSRRWTSIDSREVMSSDNQIDCHMLYRQRNCVNGKRKADDEVIFL